MQQNIKKIIALLSAITVIFIASAVILLRKPIGEPKFEYSEFEARYELPGEDEIISFIIPDEWNPYGGHIYMPGETIYIKHKDYPSDWREEKSPTSAFAISPSSYHTDDEYRQIVDNAISGEYADLKEYLTNLSVNRYYNGVTPLTKLDGYFINVTTYNIDGGKIIMFEESVPSQGSQFHICTYINTKYPQYLFVTGSGKSVGTEYTDKRPWIIQSFEIIE